MQTLIDVLIFILIGLVALIGTICAGFLIIISVAFLTVIGIPIAMIYCFIDILSTLFNKFKTKK